MSHILYTSQHAWIYESWGGNFSPTQFFSPKKNIPRLFEASENSINAPVRQDPCNSSTHSNWWGDSRPTWLYYRSRSKKSVTASFHDFEIERIEFPGEKPSIFHHGSERSNFLTTLRENKAKRKSIIIGFVDQSNLPMNKHVRSCSTPGIINKKNRTKNPLETLFACNFVKPGSSWSEIGSSFPPIMNIFSPRFSTRTPLFFCRVRKVPW